jgi:hypothetical protein
LLKGNEHPSLLQNLVSFGTVKAESAFKVGSNIEDIETKPLEAMEPNVKVGPSVIEGLTQVVIG